MLRAVRSRGNKELSRPRDRLAAPRSEANLVDADRQHSRLAQVDIQKSEDSLSRSRSLNLLTRIGAPAREGASIVAAGRNALPRHERANRACNSCHDALQQTMPI